MPGRLLPPSQFGSHLRVLRGLSGGFSLLFVFNNGIFYGKASHLTDFDLATSRKVSERNLTDGFLRARANRGLQRTCEVSQGSERKQNENRTQAADLAQYFVLKMCQYGERQQGGGGSPALGKFDAMGVTAPGEMHDAGVCSHGSPWSCPWACMVKGPP